MAGEARREPRETVRRIRRARAVGLHRRFYHDPPRVQFRDWLFGRIEELADQPTDRLLAMFASNRLLGENGEMAGLGR